MVCALSIFSSLHQVDPDEISETVQTDRVAFKDQLVLIGLCGRQVSVAACVRKCGGMGSILVVSVEEFVLVVCRLSWLSP